MTAAARRGDFIVDGYHCHGHTHGPQPSPGRIITGATKVFIDGRAAARTGDCGYSAVCCGGVGQIVIMPSGSNVIIEGKPAARVDTPTLHCGMAPGKIKTGSRKTVFR